jgi:hypothetical protein
METQLSILDMLFNMQGYSSVISRILLRKVAYSRYDVPSAMFQTGNERCIGTERSSLVHMSLSRIFILFLVGVI